MVMTMKRIGLLTSGGDCQGLNSALRGVAKSLYFRFGKDVEIYGIRDGYRGLIEGDLKKMSPSDFSGILTNGGTILGTSRQPFKLMRVPDENGLDKVEAMKHTYHKLNLDCLVILGGNGTQKTANLLREEGLNIITLPKTIDNDLGETDHCPGFGSAAKFIATAFTEIACDCFVYDVPSVTIVEVMGRNAGWLTAASALARIEGRKVPQLIYLCEKAFDEDRFIEDVNEALKKENNIIIAVSEGVKTADGNYVGEETKSGKEDVFGHKYLSGVGKYLEGLVGEKIGCKVRSVELNILQRCAGYMLSETDIMESRNLGAFAAVSAIRGKSGKMSAVRRISDDPYQVEIVLSDLSKIANYEKKVPMEWINEEGNDIKDELLTYLKPLIQGEVQIPYENGIPKRFIL